MRPLVATALCLACLGGCSFKEKMSHDDGWQNLHPGEHVIVVTRTGQAFELEVSAATADAISGYEADRGPLTLGVYDVRRIERLHLSVARTLALVLGALLATLLGAFLWASNRLDHDLDRDRD